MSGPGSRLPFKRVYSAGGVVFRRQGGDIEVVVCGQRETGVWALPKGSPHAGESMEETASREVEEETGLRVNIVRKIGNVEYWFVEDGVRYFKTVYYYLMKPVGGDMADHDPEFDEVRWSVLSEALGQLSYENDTKIVRQAEEMVRAGGEHGSV